MTRPATHLALAAMTVALLRAAPAGAQAPTDTTSHAATDTANAASADTVIPPPPPPPPLAPALPFDFSGVLFSRFQYGGQKGSRTQNRFDVERAYLTFRTSAGEHVSIRVTGDVFQRNDTAASTYYRGWTLRAKYAYAQYDFLRGIGDELKANARLGILHTPIIDYEEQFWPRGVAQVAVEQNGFFSSSDVGGATTVTFPAKLGELYATVLNGSGYTSPETDRFKDYGARLTLTPFATGHSILRTFSLTPWFYKGERGSDFTRGQGTLDPVNEGRTKDRYGFFGGIRDPRITLAGQLAWRKDEFEAADTLVATAPSVTSRTGRVLSGYTIVKPLTFVSTAPSWPVSAIFRFDQFKPNTDADASQRFIVAGLGYDLSKKASLWFDYQTQEPKDGSSAADLKTYFVHLIANF